MNIYIGNFSYDTTEEDLQSAFATYGSVETVKIIKDKFTGESRGFAFVEMPDQAEAQAALKGITEVSGRRVTINEARPQERQSSDRKRQGGGYRGSSYGRSRGY